MAQKSNVTYMRIPKGMTLVIEFCDKTGMQVIHEEAITVAHEEKGAVVRVAPVNDNVTNTKGGLRVQFID